MRNACAEGPYGMHVQRDPTVKNGIGMDDSSYTINFNLGKKNEI